MNYKTQSRLFDYVFLIGLRAKRFIGGVRAEIMVTVQLLPELTLWADSELFQDLQG